MFSKIENWFLNHSAVENTELEHYYFFICRTKNKLEDLYWYGPKNFIKNVWLYREFLWTNHWWDYVYLLEMIRTKLTIDRQYYDKYGTSVSSKIYALEMKLCALILERLIRDDYDSELINKHDKKWRIDQCNGDDFIDCINNRKNHLTGSEKTQEKLEYLQTIKQINENKDKDFEKVFTYIYKNVQNWWD
jgi:hypothetical protein